jgi:hypothetical protein
MKRSKTLLSIIGMCLLLAGACKKEEPTSTVAASGSTPLSVRMTDAPGDYQEVNIDLVSVEVHSDNGGWQTLTVKKGIYNLLKLSNGLDTMIGNAVIPSGNVSQIRLILGERNTVKTNGVVYPLSTPSAEQSGLKLQVHENLVPNIAYTILLDFDAGRSIVQTGSGTYKLKPVIRTIPTALNGGIKGTVSPVAAKPNVLAILGTDTTSTYADSTGFFLLKGLQAGSYKLVFRAAAPYKDSTVTDVKVTLGSITSYGTMALHK